MIDWSEPVNSIVDDILEYGERDIIYVLKCDNGTCKYETSQDGYEEGDVCPKCGKGHLVEKSSIREGDEVLDIDELPILDHDSKQWHHEKQRISTMSQNALRTRIYKTSPAKLVFFANALEDENYHDLAELAFERLGDLGYKFDYDLNTYVRKIHKH